MAIDVEYVERMEYLAIQVFILGTVKNDAFFEKPNV